MARLGRPGMSDEMKADLWRRWKAGESISVISRQIGKPPGSVFTVLKHHGGIAPAPRKARPGSLTVGEREEISRGLCAGESYRAIAGLLGRAVSTISREVNKNGGRDVYRAIAAQERSLDRARRPKQCLLARRPELRQAVLSLLKEEWSPEQITALDINPTRTWTQHEYAMVLKLTGAGGEHERWERAVRLLNEEVSRGGREAVGARGNLLIVLCAMGDWPTAMDQLELFVAAAPVKHRIREALDDLADLARTLPVETDKLEQIRCRLENALNAPSRP